jgi:hypothetical protein
MSLNIFGHFMIGFSQNWNDIISQKFATSIIDNPQLFFSQKVYVGNAEKLRK